MSVRFRLLLGGLVSIVVMVVLGNIVDFHSAGPWAQFGVGVAGMIPPVLAAPAYFGLRDE